MLTGFLHLLLTFEGHIFIFVMASRKIALLLGISIVLLLEGATNAFVAFNIYSRTSNRHDVVNPFRHPMLVVPSQSVFVLNSRTPPDPDSESSERNPLRRTLNTFIQYFWKGITLPFPLLRGLADVSSDARIYGG